MAATTTDLHPILALRDPCIVQGEDARVERLAFDILHSGQTHAILATKDGVIIDGWLRELACRRIGKPPIYRIIPLSLDALVGRPPASASFTAEIIRHLRDSAASSSEAGLRRGQRSRRAKMVQDLLRGRLGWVTGTSTGTIEAILRQTQQESICWPPEAAMDPKGFRLDAEGVALAVGPGEAELEAQPQPQPSPQVRLKRASSPGPEDIMVQDACQTLLNSVDYLFDSGRMASETEAILRMTRDSILGFTVGT